MKTAIGVFGSDKAGRVIDDLLRIGCAPDHISVVSGNHVAAQDSGDKNSGNHQPSKDELGTRIQGLHAMTMPEIGEVFVTGPLGERFAGATLRESLVDSGLPEPAATRYAETIKDGGALIAADVEDADVQQVLDVMTLYVQEVDDS
jgi:hypothetical protein